MLRIVSSHGFRGSRFANMNIGKSTSVLPSLHYNRNDHNDEGIPTGIRHYSSSSSNVLDLLATPAGATVGLTGLAAVGTMGWLLTRYKVARPNEYLVRTGPFLKDDIDISKQAFWLPYQTLTRIDLKPDPYHCEIDSMSAEKIELMLPTNFTIGPKDDIEFLRDYAKYMHGSSMEDLRKKVISVIHGETRACINKMSMEELFSDRDKFKKTIVDEIKDKLQAFGLVTYTANFDEMRDKKGNVYFEHVKTRALESAINEAKVATSEKKAYGDIGEKQYTTKARTEVASYEKDAMLAENERAREISSSVKDLDIAKVEFQKQVNLAKYEAEAEAEKEKLKWQTDVEIFRNKQEIERLRAAELARTAVDAERAIKEAEGKSSAQRIEAEGFSQATRLRADALAFQTIREGEALAESMKRKAEATFIERENEAKGIKLLREAESQGLSKLIDSAGDIEKLNGYLMVHRGMITEIAGKQAEAVHGMKPTITIWQAGQKGGNNLSGVMEDLVTSAVPLANAIKNSTGVDLLQSYRQSK